MKPLNTFKLITQTSCCALLVLTAAIGSTPVMAADEDPAYQMSVIQDRSHGDLVARGNYDKAIVQISADHDHFPFATATNLCVAHTMVGQYKHAEHWCDKALAEAEKAAAKNRRRNRDYTLEWAVAYSNRGVLRARMGDPIGAEADFLAAIEMQSGTMLPVNNLANLNEQGSEALATTRK